MWWIGSANACALMINGCSRAPAKYLFCKSKASLDGTASTFTIIT